MEKRLRERIAAGLTGSGVVQETGQPFSFRVVDFSVNGLLLDVGGLLPAAGQKVSLDFELDDPGEGPRLVGFSGEIVRLAGGAGETICGIKRQEDPGTASIEELETLYTELFFKSIS